MQNEKNVGTTPGTEGDSNRKDTLPLATNKGTIGQRTLTLPTESNSYRVANLTKAREAKKRKREETIDNVTNKQKDVDQTVPNPPLDIIESDSDDDVGQSNVDNTISPPRKKLRTSQIVSSTLIALGLVTFSYGYHLLRPYIESKTSGVYESLTGEKTKNKWTM